MPDKDKTIQTRLRERAAAFNDVGLRYGVADLLNEAAEVIELHKGEEEEPWTPPSSF